MHFTIALERPRPQELAALMSAVGWGSHDDDELSRSIAAYTATACARDAQGILIGYASVFSDGVFTTMLGELVVRPDGQLQGVGKALMHAVEVRYPHAPIYVKALGASRDFYAAIGFKVASAPMTPMFKKPPFSQAIHGERCGEA